MVKTNERGYLCDYPCDVEEMTCQVFLDKGCPLGMTPLEPNTEYPEYIKIRLDNGEKGNK